MPATSTKELDDRKGFRRRRTEMGGGDKGWKYAYAILMFGPKYRTKSLILYVHYFSESTNVCVHAVFEEPIRGTPLSNRVKHRQMILFQPQDGFYRCRATVLS